MSEHGRRSVLICAGGALAGLLVGGRTASASDRTFLTQDAQRFIAEAERTRRAAVRAGDQSFGAIVVRGRDIVGWGPSRVVVDRNPAAHAERVAIWDAQARLGAGDLSGCLLYSTSRPCSACETAAAAARIDRMHWGKRGLDAGQPRG